MAEPVGEIRYSGDVEVHPFRRGTYLGADYLEELIERALGDRYSFGQGWQGYADVSIVFQERRPGPAAREREARARTRRES
ncbi:MAG TPA: hypothetical protein VMS63_01120 [Gaiellaceae bacterium]|jgi:hypothetical protein|nr:hypothetical protein [Gaiellaceae bacterium]